MAVTAEKYRAAATRWSARRQVALGLLTLCVLVVGVGGWSVFANITGAVVATGQLKVESNRQVVQHLDGGVVSEILVKEGDVVEAGQTLLRLDEKLMRAELNIVEGQLYEIMARRGRLMAERDNLEAPVFSKELLEVAESSAEVASLVEGQRQLFFARKDTAARETEQLRERQTQIEEEITGAEAQRAALANQMGFVSEEMDALKDLLAKGLAQKNRVMALERENARLFGQEGELKAAVARLRGEISEIEIQILGLETTRRETAITELRDFEFRENELRERRNSLLETLDRLDIRAPRPGVVIGMTIHALRSVVRAAEPILYIVPSDVELVVEARINATDIDQVYPGQAARLRFSAFSMRTTPDIAGVVVKVSPDAFTDEATGVSYYTAEVDFDRAELAKLGELELVAGMPVEAYISTGDRTPFSYFTKPLTDYFQRAWRES